MAKGSIYGAKNENVSFRLYPVELEHLRELSAIHGGAGRAVQVAIELLRFGSCVKLDRDYFPHLPKNYDKKPMEVFTISAPKRVRDRLNHYGIQYEGVNNVIRLCVIKLNEISEEDFFLDPRVSRLDDVYDPDSSADRP